MPLYDIGYFKHKPVNEKNTPSVEDIKKAIVRA